MVYHTDTHSYIIWEEVLYPPCFHGYYSLLIGGLRVPEITLAGGHKISETKVVENEP